MTELQNVSSYIFAEIITLPNYCWIEFYFNTKNVFVLVFVTSFMRYDELLCQSSIFFVISPEDV